MRVRREKANHRPEICERKTLLLKYAFITGVIIGIVIACFYVMDVIACSSVHFMLATCAQVSITALALIAAATAIAFSRFDLGNSEDAFKAVVRSPRTLSVIGALTLAVIGSIVILLAVPEPSPLGVHQQLYIPIAITIGMALVGIVGAVFWLINAHSIMGVVPILGTLAQLIPEDWVKDANRYVIE